MEKTSKARLTAKFNDGITSQEAWESLTAMFKEHPSLVPGSPSLSPSKEDNEIRVGDIFKSRNREVEIVAWHPGKGFAYREQAISNPLGHGIMDFVIVGDAANELTLSVVRTQTSIQNALSRKNRAAEILNSVAGPEAYKASAYAGGWLRLPIHGHKIETSWDSDFRQCLD